MQYAMVSFSTSFFDFVSPKLCLPWNLKDLWYPYMNMNEYYINNSCDVMLIIIIFHWLKLFRASFYLSEAMNCILLQYSFIEIIIQNTQREKERNYALITDDNSLVSLSMSSDELPCWQCLCHLFSFSIRSEPYTHERFECHTYFSSLNFLVNDAFLLNFSVLSPE